MYNTKGVIVCLFPLGVGFMQALKDIIAQERPHVLGLQETRISAAAAAAAGRSTQKAQTNTRKKTDSSSSSFTDIVKTILPDYHTFCEGTL